MDSLHLVLLWTWWLFWDWALPPPEAPPFEGLELEDMTQAQKAAQIHWAIKNPKKNIKFSSWRYRNWRRSDAGRQK